MLLGSGQENTSDAGNNQIQTFGESGPKMCSPRSLGLRAQGSRPRAQGHRAEARQGNESEAAARLLNQRRNKREERVSHPRPTAQGLATNQARKPGPGFKWHLACYWDLPSPGSPCLESSEASVNALATAKEKEEFLRTHSSSQAHWLPP